MPIKFGEIEKAQFFVLQDGEYKPLGNISECDLSIEPTPEEEVLVKRFSSKDLTMSIDIAADSVVNLEKYIICGGDRGRYNGYRLKRDGYLSPENAWMEE